MKTEITASRAPDFEADRIETRLPSSLSIAFPREGDGTTFVPCTIATDLVLNACFSSGDGPYAVLALAMHGPAGMFGLFAPLDAQRLRNQAAFMLKAADTLDGGAGKQ